MKKILIISPHFPPSNLAAVHRSRLFAHHLPSFGWQPIILTVDEKYYEEALDYNLEKLLPPGLRIE
ncbi:MAG: glycosyltransferase, partial [Aquabacterium sp.]|nr:glycosyltransferase [Ferruginibacter sp.]